MASPLLERKNWNYAVKLKGEGKRPAAVIGAEFRNSRKVDTSRPCDPNVENVLRIKLLTLGSLYTRVNGNIIGNCAEVNASNQILIIYRYLNLNKIRFSKALRPRTMQVIKMCFNCKKTFE